MKGIILAGGSGTRLYPLTVSVSKQLMPVYDKPMIYYPLSSLMLAGIREILIITTPRDQAAYQALLGDGSQWGISFAYQVQDAPLGLAQAFTLGESFIGNDSVCLILGDNIFYGQGLTRQLQEAASQTSGASVFACYVNHPEAYGIVEFDQAGKPCSIVEKPSNPSSHYAVAGLYFYDNQVVEMAKQLKPSARGELEISDINQLYLQQGQLRIHKMERGMTWLDMGTIPALLEAAHFIEVLEKRQGLKVACPEEIAWRMGYIDAEQVSALAQPLLKSGYGHYLLDVIAS